MGLDVSPSTTTLATDISIPRYGSNHENQACLTQKAVVQVTLAGPGLILTVLAMIFAIQTLQPSLTCTLIALAPLFFIIHNDYENFILLGPGGTPATISGYLTITYLRLFALSDPYTPAPVIGRIFPVAGCYRNARFRLPNRNGPRPAVRGIAPQRQINQPGCPEMYQRLRAILHRTADEYSDTCEVGQSCFEKQGLALFARRPVNNTCRGEIVHVHHSDRSMHMNLHPEDAKIVLERGWGERHPLARGGWMRAYVPREFVLVYAPRNHAELEVVCRIIEAAAYWVSAEELDLVSSDT